MQSLNYRNLWDPSVISCAAKNAMAVDRFHLRRIRLGQRLRESGPGKASWAVQHDVAGLAIHQRDPGFADILDHLFHQPPVFHTGRIRK